MNIMPWEEFEYKSDCVGRSYMFGRMGPSINYTRTIRHIKDNKSQIWRKGDLIQFENGQYHPFNKDWKDWFLSERDYIKFLKSVSKRRRDNRIPLYAVNQYAIVIGRYRVVKNKFGTKYYDYGTVIMMITGSMKGRVRRYYTCSPFEKISTFPYKKVPSQLEDFSDIVLQHTEDSDKCRNLFVSTLYENFK